RSEARVRARIVPAGPRPKVDRRRRQGRGRARGGGEGEAGPSPAATAQAAPPRREEARGGGDRDEREAREAGGGDMSTEPTLAEEGDAAVAFLEGLLEAFGRQGRVQHREIDDETVEAAVV